MRGRASLASRQGQGLAGDCSVAEGLASLFVLTWQSTRLSWVPGDHSLRRRGGSPVCVAARRKAIVGRRQRRPVVDLVSCACSPGLNGVAIATFMPELRSESPGGLGIGFASQRYALAA
jgi:hypothetical protein